MSELLNLDEFRPWLKLCGACDIGIGECAHPLGDYRVPMSKLFAEVERLRRVLADVASLTRSTDGDDLHPDEEVPVGEVQRMLFDRPAGAS